MAVRATHLPTGSRRPIPHTHHGRPLRVASPSITSSVQQREASTNSTAADTGVASLTPPMPRRRAVAARKILPDDLVAVDRSAFQRDIPPSSPTVLLTYSARCSTGPQSARACSNNASPRSAGHSPEKPHPESIRLPFLTSLEQQYRYFQRNEQSAILLHFGDTQIFLSNINATCTYARRPTRPSGLLAMISNSLSRRPGSHC